MRLQGSRARTSGAVQDFVRVWVVRLGECQRGNCRV